MKEKRACHTIFSLRSEPRVFVASEREGQSGFGARVFPAARDDQGRQQVSRTDPESRFLRASQGWELGYTADRAVSDDHLIVAARVTQNAADNGSLVPMVDEVE